MNMGEKFEWFPQGMPEEEKGKIRKIARGAVLIPENKMEDYGKAPRNLEDIEEDLDYLKFCEDINRGLKNHGSMEKAFKETRSFYLSQGSAAHKKYEKHGRITFQDLEKAYHQKLEKIGLQIEEIRGYEVKKITEKDEKGKEQTETIDVPTKKDLLSIDDYRKFTEYLKNIKVKDLSDKQLQFLALLTENLIDGMKKYYEVRESDKRLEEFMLASDAIITELKRINIEGNVFLEVHVLERYVLAARENLLIEYRERQNQSYRK